MPHPLDRAPRRRRRARQLFLSASAAALAFSLATVATLAGARFLAAERTSTAGAPRPAATATAPPNATSTPAAISTLVASASPTPSGASPSAPPAEGSQKASARDAVLISLDLPAAASPARSALDEVARVLAVSRDGEVVASVGRFGAPGALHVTRRDGPDRQFRMGPSGASAPVGAAFSPDGSWIAVVNGFGELWGLDVASGRPRLISAGVDGMVFGISVAFAPDGRLLVTQVASIEMPLPSRLAALDTQTGDLQVLSDQTGAYRPVPSQDGAILFFATREDGTTEVRRLLGGSEEVVATLGQTAWVDASPDGGHVVAERPDGVVVLVNLGTGRSVDLGRGARPEFSPSGEEISILDVPQGRARVVDLSGRQSAAVPSLVVAWAECPAEGCDS